MKKFNNSNPWTQSRRKESTKSKLLPHINPNQMKKLKLNQEIQTLNGTNLLVIRIHNDHFVCKLPMNHPNEYRGKEVHYDISTGKAKGMINVSDWDIHSISTSDQLQGQYNDY